MVSRMPSSLARAPFLAGIILAAASAGEPAEKGKEAGEAPPPPGGAPGPADENPRVRELVASHLNDLEGAAMTATAGGLKVKAFIVPDALAYRICQEYLKRRDGGEDHAAAVKGTAPFLAPWKRCQGMAAVRVRMEDASPARAAATPPTVVTPRRRLFTLQKSFDKDALAIFSGKTRLPVRLAGPPRNMRQAQLRTKKFWKMAEGPGRQKRGDPGDPNTYGREPVLSKPFPALLIEGLPAIAEALFKAKGERGLPTSLTLSGFKKYEGPFADDILDLNQGRSTWVDVEAISVDLRPPPGGLEIPRAVVDLIEEVRVAAALRR